MPKAEKAEKLNEIPSGITVPEGFGVVWFTIGSKTEERDEQREIGIIGNELLETKWKVTKFSRWEDIPAGYEREQEKYYILETPVGLLFAIYRLYKYSLDNGLQEEEAYSIEFYKLPEIELGELEIEEDDD